MYFTKPHGGSGENKGTERMQQKNKKWVQKENKLNSKAIQEIVCEKIAT